VRDGHEMAVGAAGGSAVGQNFGGEQVCAKGRQMHGNLGCWGAAGGSVEAWSRIVCCGCSADVGVIRQEVRKGGPLDGNVG